MLAALRLSLARTLPAPQALLTCPSPAQALAKYAFGLGSLQMLTTTAAFTLFALPVGAGIGTQILVKIFHVSPELASIRSVDEAIVIGAALSLSSSAFVLQLLGESGEMNTKVGSATLGILLLQVRSQVLLCVCVCVCWGG